MCQQSGWPHFHLNSGCISYCQPSCNYFDFYSLHFIDQKVCFDSLFMWFFYSVVPVGPGYIVGLFTLIHVLLRSSECFYRSSSNNTQCITSLQKLPLILTSHFVLLSTQMSVFFVADRLEFHLQQWLFQGFLFNTF